MVKNEGILRPIRGLPAVVAGAGPAHALYFASYEFAKESLTNFTTQHHQLNYGKIYKIYEIINISEPIHCSNVGSSCNSNS